MYILNAGGLLYTHKRKTNAAPSVADVSVNIIIIIIIFILLLIIIIIG